MIARFLPASPTLADRFGHLLYWVFEGMAQDWRRRGLTHVHAAEISLRMLGLWKRVHRVLEKWRAGTLRAPRARKRGVRVADPSPDADPPPQGAKEFGIGTPAKRVLPGWSVLPRTFGWLRTLLLPESLYHVNAFYPLLNEDAEMQAIIAAAPQQIGRALRPFCHFLGLEVPAALRLPKRVRAPGLRGRAAGSGGLKPTLRRRDAAGEMIIPNRRLPAKEQAEDAARRAETCGKPIDVTIFSAEAYGWFLHPPRDDNCPPPKIGYGGRLRPLPRDYRPQRDE